MRKSLIAGFLLFFCYSTAVIAQSYSVQHYTDENGLPQNSVKFIAPDGNGFLWLATENGLVRFEGNRFKSFNSARISCIYPNAGRNGLLAKTDKQQVISMHNGLATWEKTPPVSQDYEYLVYNDTTGRYPVVGLPNVFKDLIEVEEYIIPTSGQAYFQISRDSVSFIDEERRQYAFPYHNSSPWTFFSIAGRLYHMTEEGRFRVFDRDSLREVSLTGVDGKDFELYWNYVAEQVFIRHGSKLYLLSLERGNVLHARLVLSGFDLKRNGILSVYFDREQERTFLGSWSKGLYVFTKKQFSPFASRSDVSNVFYAQVPYGDNGILTPQGLIFDQAGNAKDVRLLQQKGILAEKYSMYRDGQGNFWYENGSTVYKYDSSLTAILWQHTFRNDDVRQLYLGQQDRLWIGTEYKGLYCLDVTDPVPEPVLYSAAIKDASYMLHETPELLWVGTGKGLFRIHLPSRHTITVKPFRHEYIRSLFIPAPGEIWITTYDSGFFLYRRNKITPMPADRKNYLNTAHCIMADDRGYFWITTNKGLFQASHKDLLAYADGRQQYVYYHYYSKPDGFLTNEFNGGCAPCALKLKNGDISLPSLDGLVRFAPGNIHPDLPDGQLFIDEVEVDTTQLAASDTISLPNKFLRFGLRVGTPYFGDAYNLRMYYSLEGGANAAWLPVADNGVIYFSKMRSGTYHLRIRKVSGFGLDNYTDKVITLVVEPGWFETVWFRVLLVCLLVLLVLGYNRLRMIRVRKKNRLLQQHVQERTRELEETLDFLKASEHQLRKQSLMQQRLITAITHDIKTPMKYLLLVSSSADKEDKKAAATHDALYRMYHLVENLIQYLKMQAIEHHDGLQYVDLHELLEEKAGIFRPIAEARAVQIQNLAGRGIQVPVNRQLLAVVINNLLDNAVKYTVTGSVSMGASYRQGALSIQITDTGVGMEPAMREWINRNQYVLHETEPLPFMQKGIGLMIVMELLQQINGRLVVHANEDAGTRMEVVLHLN